MSLILIPTIAFMLIFISKKLFDSYFNHLAIYTIGWAVICFFYELKLIRFINITTEAWGVIFSGTFSYFLGVITYYKFKNEPKSFKLITKRLSFNQKEIKIIYYIILITGIINLIISLLNWKYLINKFGSITNVFLQANQIYKMRIEGEMPEAVPYLYTIGYAGVFFSGIYAAYTNKLKIAMFVAFISIALKEVSAFGREGILIALLLFSFSYFFTIKAVTGKKIFNFKENKKNIIIIGIVLIIAVSGANLVRSTRGAFEHFKGTNRALANSPISFIITPSMYFYFSSHVGVLSKYLQSPTPKTSFAANTLLPLHNILSKFEFVEKKSFYQKGYFIPQWSNTGTYLREVHEDFGDIGIFIVPFLLGLFISFLWYKYHEAPNLNNLLWLSYFNVLNTLTWLVILTRSSKWLIGMILTYLIILLFEKIRLKSNAESKI
jgi:oligosaccharide repeat unit polymerase